MIDTEKIVSAVNYNGVPLELGGGITPTGNINITDTNVTDVTNYATAQVVDADLVAENIKKNINILGVVGSFEGGGSSAQIATGTITIADGTAQYIKVTGLGFTPKAFAILNTFNNGNHSTTQGASFINGHKQVYRTNSSGVPASNSITGNANEIFPTFTVESDSIVPTGYNNSAAAVHVTETGFVLQGYSGSFPFYSGDVFEYWAIG